MNSGSFWSRSLSTASVLLALLAPSEAATAQGAVGAELLSEPAATESRPASDLRSLSFEGLVLAPNGTPAEGAVVVSSAGGQAVTDASGSFRLGVHAPVEADTVQLTAVGREGSTLVASQSIGIAGVTGVLPVMPLRLSQASTCTPSWVPTFGGAQGMDDQVNALTVFDDGGGAALYAGGEFTQADGGAANGIAKWNGSAWAPLGSGLNDVVTTLAVYDDGGGAALYAGGRFTTAGGLAASFIAKWDGSSWTPLGAGTDHWVLALAVYDDGGGAALYAGGFFATAGGGAASFIAKWDGSTWTPLGTGVSGRVEALTVFDDGSGEALYAGGGFATAGGVAAGNLAKWDGASWSAVGSGMNDIVMALTVFDDGGGAGLCAGGWFTTAGGVAASRIAKWDGSGWSALGLGVNNPVTALAVHDDGGGAVLCVGGWFTKAGGVPQTGFARWDGSSWAGGGGGLGIFSALTEYDDGSGPALYGGGNLPIEGEGNHIAEWDGSSWTGVSGNATPSLVSGNVRALAQFDDGGGPALYAGGQITIAGGAESENIARWDGASWTALGSGVAGNVFALTVFDDGGGAALYAGGNFATADGLPARNIAKWDGSGWTALGGGLGSGSNSVLSLTVFDDGGGDALYAGGSFSGAVGVAASRIAKWDGSAWTVLGSGMNSTVHALTVFDDGGGDALYAGGQFTTAGGGSARNIAKWDGSSWSVLASGGSTRGGHVRALVVHDDGGGESLYAGGSFGIVGGVSVNKIAKWDGSGWTALGAGVGGTVESLAVFDDGGGEALYVGGALSIAGGMAANNIVKWDGSGWSALDSGVSDSVNALAVYDDGGSGPALYAGGEFTASPAGDPYLAKWGCALAAGPTTYCTAGTSANGCQAVLSAVGVPSATAATGFTLSATGVEGVKDGLYFFGANGRQANTWGSGTSFQCVQPPVRRAGLLIGIGSIGACDGSFSQDLNVLWNTKPAKNPGAGAVVQAQLWYRDPFNTSNQTTSLSDAIEFTVEP